MLLIWSPHIELGSYLLDRKRQGETQSEAATSDHFVDEIHTHFFMHVSSEHLKLQNDSRG